uniref:TSA: Wollemia nobilis Ref_Wollemi_Transcript_13801_1561 transcribed RNA sequence n=1 Tax=Wollemia nobilis TaxID=56998 RepID=A0A0C9S7D8_9CONI
MSPLQLCSVVFALLAFFIWLRGIRRSSKGPTIWPIVGYLPSLIFHLDHLHDWFNDLLALNGGTVRLHGPWNGKILTADPANIEYVLRTRYHNFGKGDSFKETFRDVFGDSHLVEDGERFAEVNKVVGMALASATFRDAAAVAIPAAVHAKLLPLLRRACEKRATIDLQDVFLRLAFDIVCLVGFGIDPGSFGSDLHLPRVPYLEAYEDAVEATMIRMFTPAFCWKTVRHFDLTWERRLRRGQKIMEQYVDDNLACRPLHVDTFSSLIKPLFLRVGWEYSENALRPLVGGLLLAGKDTICAALTFFFWAVAQNPRVEANILAELQGIVTNRPDVELHNICDPSPFFLEEVKRMHYLHAALRESLRLYPPVPMESMEAVEDDVLPDGTAVRKGWQVLYSIYASGRAEKVWGEDCREFRPERWLKDGKFVKESDFKNPVFNAGPRSCVGREFAFCQMKWVVASVVVRYRVNVVDKHPVVSKFSPSLYMKNGLVVTIHRRE